MDVKADGYELDVVFGAKILVITAHQIFRFSCGHLPPLVSYVHTVSRNIAHAQFAVSVYKRYFRSFLFYNRT